MEEKKYENEENMNSNQTISSTIFDDLFLKQGEEEKKEEISKEETTVAKEDVFVNSETEKEIIDEAETSEEIDDEEKYEEEAPNQDQANYDTNIPLEDTMLNEAEQPDDSEKDIWLNQDQTSTNNEILNLQAQLPHITISDVDEDDIFVSSSLEEEEPKTATDDIWANESTEEYNNKNLVTEKEFEENGAADIETPLEIDSQNDTTDNTNSVDDVFVETQAESDEKIVDPIFEKWRQAREEEKNKKEEPIEETPVVEFSPSPKDLEDVFVSEETYTLESQPQPQVIVEENNQQSTTKNEETIDYFDYDFGAEVQENIQPTSTQNPAASEEALQFDFYNTIRPTNEQPQLPQEEKIEFSKIFAQRDHSNDSEQIINIDEDKGNEYRRQKAMAKFSLYAFYFFIAVFVLLLVTFLIQRKSKFELVRDEITLALQSTYQAEILADTEIQENTDYEWNSLDTNIATVDNNGVIKAEGIGNTIITVKSKKSRKEKKLQVTIIDIIINSIRFEYSKVALKEGEEMTIYPVINEDTSIIVSLDWISGDESIVTVDQNGHIKAIHAGTTTVAAFDKNGALGAEVEVIVKENKKNSTSNSSTNKPSNTNTNTKPQNIAVSRVTLDTASANLKVGESITVKATVFPTTATNKTITWSSNNTKVATVNNGKITAVAEGTAIITATSKDGNKKASITITVTKETQTPSNVKVTGVTLNKTSITLAPGESATLKATISPANATNQSLEWVNKIHNEAISVSVNGNTVTITAKKETGNSPATITVTTVDGKFSDTCEIVVKKKSSTSGSNSNSGSNSSSNSGSNSSSNSGSNSSSNSGSNSGSNSNSSSNSGSNSSSNSSGNTSSNIKPEPSIPVPTPVKPTPEEK